MQGQTHEKYRYAGYVRYVIQCMYVYVGKLTLRVNQAGVTILGAEIYSNEKFQNPNIKVRVSNQVFKTEIIAPPNPENKVG